MRSATTPNIKLNLSMEKKEIVYGTIEIILFLTFASFYYLGHLSVQVDTENIMISTWTTFRNDKNGHCTHRKHQFPKLHKLLLPL